MADTSVDRISVPSGMALAGPIFRNIQTRGEQTGALNANGDFVPAKNNGHVKGSKKIGAVNCEDRWGITQQFILDLHLREVAPQVNILKRDIGNLKKNVAALQKKKVKTETERTQIAQQIAHYRSLIKQYEISIKRIQKPTLQVKDVTFIMAQDMFARKADQMDLEKLSPGVFAAMASAAYAAPSKCVDWLRDIVRVKTPKNAPRDVVDAATIKATEAYIKKYGEQALIDKIVNRYEQYFKWSANKVTAIKKKDGTVQHVKLRSKHLKGWLDRAKRVREDAKLMAWRFKNDHIQKQKEIAQAEHQIFRDSLLVPRDALTSPTDTPAYVLIRPYSPTHG